MAEFIDFESKVDNNSDDDKVSFFTVDESSLDSFIDDTNFNLEYAVDNVDDNYSIINETRSVESTLEDVFSENDDKMIKSDKEIYNYYDSDEIAQFNIPEKVDKFKDAKNKIKSFKQTLHALQGKNLKDFFFLLLYLLCQ